MNKRYLVNVKRKQFKSKNKTLKEVKKISITDV